jgi:hypothetical protein
MNGRPWARILRGLIVFALTAMGTAAVAVPAHAGSMVVYNSAPAAGSVVIGPGCTNVHQYTYGFSGNWQSTGSGDYTGSGVYGQSSSRTCSGTTDYILDQATQTAQFRWHLETFCATGCTSVPCKIWAYIPTTDAGDYHARYDFWADDGNGNLTWLAWPGGNMDQEDNSGWAYLGSVTVGNTHILTVSLNNADSAKPGWYAGAGDIAVNCPAQQVIPAMPSGLQVTMNNTTTPGLSGVVQSSAGGEVTGEIFLQDAAGNPIGGAPTAMGVVDSGEQVTYQVPPGVLSNGSTYQWYMKACQGSVCSAPTATQSFAVDTYQKPPNGTVTATITGASVSAADAVVTSGACGGSDCATTSGAALNVGNDGASPWRSALKFELSSIPPDAQIVGAALDLTQAGCLNNCAVGNTLAIYPADSDVTAATTGPQLAAIEDTTAITSGDVAEGTYDVTGAVQGWYSTAMPNDGLVLQAAGETTASEGVSYYSPTAPVPAADLPSLVVTYLPPAAPDAPANVSALAGDGGTRVTWNPPDSQGDEQGITGYTVQALNSDGSVAARATTTGTSAILTGLADGTSYPVTVTAINAVGTGPAGTATVTPAAVAGGPAQYTQAVQQFLTAQDSLEEGSYATASDAVAATALGPDFAAALQAESANDTGQAAALATQGLVRVDDASSLSNTLVSAGESTVTVFTSDDNTYDTEAGTGTSSPVDTPGEDTTDYALTFTTGVTPVLTGYVDADATDAVSPAAVDSNAVSAQLADPTLTDPSNLGAPAATQALDANGNLSVVSETVPITGVNTAGIAAYAYNNWNTRGWAGFPGIDCTDFASQALAVGGHLREVYPWYDVFNHSDPNAWWYVTPAVPLKGGGYLFGPSHTWGDAPDLAQFLRNTHNYVYTNLGDARVGDLIFANWSGSSFSGIDHVGIITAISYYGGRVELYISQHTNNRRNEPIIKWIYTDSSGNSSKTPNPNLHMWVIHVTGS